MKHVLVRRPRSDRRAPRDTFRSLLRMRSVQAALVATAAVQASAALVAAGSGAADGSPHVAGAVLTGTPLGQARAVMISGVRAGAPSTAERLAAGYRAKGYEVPAELAEKIHRTAVRHAIDPEVAFGLVRTESDFLSRATSPVGAIGLTQLMPATARWFDRGITVARLRDPDTNLEIGFRYLRELIDRYDGDLQLALTAYNRGTGTVDRVLERGGDPDNGYAGAVLKGSR
jgi:soluble lytic murein transglycosylase-like protein